MFDFLSEGDDAKPRRQRPAASAGDRPLPIIRKPVPVSESGPLLPPKRGAPVEPPPELTNGSNSRKLDLDFPDRKRAGRQRPASPPGNRVPVDVSPLNPVAAGVRKQRPEGPGRVSDQRIVIDDEFDLSGLDDTLAVDVDWSDSPLGGRIGQREPFAESFREPVKRPASRGRWFAKALAVLFIAVGIGSFVFTNPPDWLKVPDIDSLLGRTETIASDDQADSSTDSVAAVPSYTPSPLLQKFQAELARLEQLVDAGSLDEADKALQTMDRTVYGYGAAEFAALENKIDQLRSGVAVSDLVDDQAAAAEANRQAAEQAAQVEATRLAEEQAAREEAARVAAEQAAQAQAARLAEEQATREEAARLAEERAAQAEAERLAEQRAANAEAERLAARAEAERLAEQQAASAEAERLAQQQAAREASARQAQEQTAREEAARLAEEQAARVEQVRLAEQAARAEAERLEQARAAAAASSAQTIDADRIATDKRIAEERAALQRQQAREQRLREAREREAQAEQARTAAQSETVNDSAQASAQPDESLATANQSISDDELQLVYRRFINLQKAISERDINSVVSLTERSGVRVQQFMQMFENSSEIDARIRNVSTSNATGEIKGTLQINRVRRANGSYVKPPASLSSIALSSKRGDDGWSAITW